MIFIRINDPKRIESDSDSFYFNSLLKKTLDRHYLSNRIFDHFFMNSFSNEERWDFIEDFFLGIDIDELIENHPGIQNESKVDIIKYLEDHAHKNETPSKSISHTNEVLRFPPDETVFYKLDSMITLVENEIHKTLNVSRWLIEDPIRFDRTRKELNLKIDKDVFELLVSKLKQFPEYFKDSLGLNHRIEFDGYDGSVKAKVPYKDKPIEFYKWWLCNKELIKMTFKERIELFNKVHFMDKSVLKKEHKKELLK